MRNEYAKTIFQKDEAMSKTIDSLEEMNNLYIDILIDVAANMLSTKRGYEIQATVYYALRRLPLYLVFAKKKRNDLKILIMYISNNMSEYVINEPIPITYNQVTKLIDDLKEELDNQKYDIL